MESRCLFYIVFTENKIVSISNFNFVNYTTLAGFAVTLSGTQNEEFYYSNWYHYNIKAQHGFISAIGFNIIHINTVFDAVQPPLSSPPVNLEESWSLKFFKKNFYVKKFCLRTCFELNLLFSFCFSI